jgi:protein-disulfide isomerase
MAAAGSMKGFYTALAAVALGGGVFILGKAMKSKPPLTTQTLAPLAVGPRGVTAGSDSAPVQILEFSDFECPYCAAFASIQMPDAHSRLIGTGKVRWTFVHFPLDGHTKSPIAHLAAACANEQGRFWEMHDQIYQHQAEWTESRNPERALADYAAAVGLDRTRYRQCVDGRTAWGTVLADKALGDSIGVTGTPTFFLEGREVQSPRGQAMSVDLLLKSVDSAIAAKRQPTTTRH